MPYLALYVVVSAKSGSQRRDRIGWRHVAHAVRRRGRSAARGAGCLRQFAPETRLVFGELPFAEIARAEGITENAAKVSFHHAVRRLQAWLGRRS